MCVCVCVCLSGNLSCTRSHCPGVDPGRQFSIGHGFCEQVESRQGCPGLHNRALALLHKSSVTAARDWEA